MENFGEEFKAEIERKLLLLLRCHNVKNGKEASEVTEKIPAGCAGESKQSKGKEKRKVQR